jgi:peroxiredoxin
MNRVLLALLAAVLALSACTGKDAVDQTGGSTYNFGGATPLGKLFPEAKRKPAHDFTGELINGGTVTLSSTRGQVVVLNYWAAWCGPCKTETPQFDLLYRQIKSQGVHFIGIDTKDVKGNAQAFIRNNNISFPIVFDEPGETAVRLGNLPTVNLPFTVLIDKQGKVAAVYIVRLSVKDLHGAIDKLLAEQ